MDDEHKAPANEELKTRGTSIIIELTDEEAERLAAAIEQGYLKEFGVKSIRTLDADEANQWAKSEREKRRQKATPNTETGIGRDE
jgi:predicted metal-dependent phosphoesterase TrpH